MKRLFVWMIFLWMSSAVFADITVVQKVKNAQPAGMPAMPQTIYAKKNKAKIDFSGGAFLLIDLKDGKRFLVIPSEKQVSLMPAGKWGASGNLAEMIGKKPTVKKTGQSKIISGYKCNQYIWSVTTPNSVEWIVDYWVTEEIDPKEFEPFVPFTHMDFELPNIEDLQLIPGFPIRTELKFVRKFPSFQGHSVQPQETVGYTIEVQKVTHDSIPDSMFTIPKGYKIMDTKPAPK
jgi:Domain of unknown function (DUF4412)